jgi:D-aspartate ligase
MSLSAYVTAATRTDSRIMKRTMSGIDRPPAIVVGFETNGLGVARALARDGVPVIGLSAPYRHPAAWTRTARVRPLPDWSEEALIRELLGLADNFRGRAPLLITKDEAVLWVSAHREELERRYFIALPDRETTGTLMSKDRFQQVAEHEGWPVPRTWQVETEQELESVIADLPFPCILKPRVKNSAFRKHAPKKAFVLKGSSELRNTYREVAQWEQEVVIQEYVGGGDDRVAFCLGYWDQNHQPLITFCGRKLRQWPIQCGNTSVCEPAPELWRARIEPLAISIFAKLGFFGLGSIEFKMRPETEEPVIMEPTVGRTNFQNEVAVINGFNIPAVAYAHGAGLPHPQPRPAPAPVQLIDELTADRAARAYCQQGILTEAACSRQIHGPSRYMLFRPDDPAPSLVRRAREMVRKLRRSANGRPADN